MYLCKLIQGCWTDRVSNVTKTVVRAPHTTSVRGNLVRTYRIDINEDYFVDADQELGKGGCGVVVVGEHKETRAQYAIKIVDKAHAERGRLDRELKLLKDVDHTNVVRLFSVYDVPSHMYFVMELCTGGHLGNLLARQPKKYLDEVWAKQLALQLLSAVAHIHSRGIAHRDIKLQNILVDQNNDRVAQLKLIDFGYGSRYVGALPMRTKCGTPYTTAPEVIREHYDERCDVWSCGVVLYIMLCGRRPFEALNITGSLADAGKAAMITNILAGRYHFNHKPWQSVSKQGLQFVKALLHPDFKQRMHSHEALENSWLVDTALTTVTQQVLVSEKSFRAAQNMRRMSDASELQRTGMVALVFGINGKVTSEMSAVFQSFDTDSSGMLSIDEFSVAMKKLCPELQMEDMEKLFHIIDYDKNNLISYTEFLAATLDPRDVDIGELNKAFRIFDEDGNGYVSREEMRKVIRMQCEQALANNAAASASASNLTDGISPRINNVTFSETLAAEVDSKVDKIFADADVNHDGAISHAEFLWVMTGLDFHLLDRLGVPAEGGFSAQDTFLYNTKINNSYDSMEEWDRDRHFDEEVGYSPRSLASTKATTITPIKQSFKLGGGGGGSGVPRAPLDPNILRANTGMDTIGASSFNSNLNTGGSMRPLGAKSDSFHGYRPISTPVNSPHTRNEWPEGPLVHGLSSTRLVPGVSTTRLDTYMERGGNNSSSSGGGGVSEGLPVVHIPPIEIPVVERPQQRSMRRPRDEPAVERKDTPPMYKGNISPRLAGSTNAEFMNNEEAKNGQLHGISPKSGHSGKNTNIAFYEEQPIHGKHEMSDEDIEMGTIVLPSSNNPSSKIPALALTPPKTALANNFITGAGASSKSSLVNPLVSIQKQHSVKFDMGPPPLTSPGMNIYRKEVDPDEGDDIRSSANSTSNLRGAFSRQPSYRESTIIDSSCGGRDTIKVLTSNKLGPLDQKPENASGTSTRQNSGDVAVHISSVEKSEPPAPFLSRASSRVFSLTNMLRSNDQRDQQAYHSSALSNDNSKNHSPLPVESPSAPMGSPISGYMPLSRAASMKGASLFRDGMF